MNKHIKHTYGGITKDITKSRYPNTNYFSAHNFRITADDSQSTFSLTNEKGTVEQFEFPTITISNNKINTGTEIINYNNNEIPVGTYSNHKLVGTISVTDGIIFFTTSNIDAIWLFNIKDQSLKLLYVRKLNFSQEYQVTGISNYENDKVEKIYWVNGKSQIRSLNIRHSIDNGDYEDIIDIPVSTLDMVGTVDLSHPTIVDTTTGGIHTAGVIQYAYSLYRINGGQSTISPMSELVALTNGNKGGDVGEQVNTIPIVRIDNIDDNYTNIIIYSIKYTSYGQLPTVSIIYDQRIPDSRSVEVYDDGNIISNITIEEFMLSNKNVIKPKHIVSKDNRLIIANYEENNFKLNLDVRAYSFSSPFTHDAVSRVYSDVESLTNLNNTPVRLITPINIPDDPFDTFDNVNLDFDTYKYALGFFNNTTGLEPIIGGTGKYVKYEIVPNNVVNEKNRYFKDNEIYRLAIEFYNVYGQTTLPMWIADFKAPQGNLNKRFNTLKFTLLPAFYTWLNNQQLDDYNKPVGYRLLVADRQAKDKTIVANGIVSTMLVNNVALNIDYNGQILSDDFDTNKEDRVPKIPSTFIRNLNQETLTEAYNIFSYLSEKSTPVQNVLHKGAIDRFQYGISTESPAAGFTHPAPVIRQYTKMLQLFSPETVFNLGLSVTGGLKMKVRGLLKNTENKVWGQELFLDGNVVMNNAKGDNALSVRYAQNITVDTGGSLGIHNDGIIGDPLASDPKAYGMSLFYRKYGIDEIDFNNTSMYLSIMSNIPYYNLVSDNELNYNQVTYSSSIQNMIITLTGDNLFYRIKTNITLNVDNNNGTPYDYEITISHGDTINTFQNTTSDSVVEIPFESIVQELNGTDYIRITAKVRNDNNIALSGSLSFSNELAGGKAIVQLSNTEDFTISDDYRLTDGPILFDTANQLVPNNLVFQNVIGNNVYEILGKPEYAQRGQSFTSYNEIDKYRYSNSITSYNTRGNGDRNGLKDKGVYGRKIVSVNSDANGNITLVPQHQNNEITLENIYTRCITEGDKINDCAPYVELVKSDDDIYLGGIYGGNSYEDKRRTKYNKIGKYTKINQNVQYILSPGDTYVQNFKFLRIVRSDDRVIDQGFYQFEEIVEYPVETTINLMYRNDASKTEWDSKISYSFDEYHKYNRVYGQQDNLFQKTNTEYYVKEINGYNTNIIATKEKTPGEVIDNWLHILTNETLTLDGKHGPISNLLSLNDQIYTLQDRAMSALSINPRVQVQGQDGISIELGSGSVLQEYNYLTTAIGCRNKFSAIATPYGIYFYDSINKRLNLFNGQITPLSESAGLHSFFKTKDLSDIDIDKPLLGQGTSFGYDYVNNDIYFTFNTLSEVFTLKYTEKGNMFVTDDDYGARHYVSNGDYTLSSLDDNIIHRMNHGTRNNYYGIVRPSKIVLVVNPEADLSVVVNNIAFKSEVYLDGVDQPNRTITHIRAYNEYQDTGLVPLVNSRRGNLQRLFREWNAQVPRVAGTRERIRNPWTFLEIVYDNQDGSQIILHDMIVSYSI